VRELPFVLRHRYRRTPYDDLLSKLRDRDSSVAFGRAANASAPGTADAIAGLLRQRLIQDSLQTVSARELSQGHVLVAGGWVVPESLALICALAARVS
jgi:hypothetical protein